MKLFSLHVAQRTENAQKPEWQALSHFFVKNSAWSWTRFEPCPSPLDLVLNCQFKWEKCRFYRPKSPSPDPKFVLVWLYPFSVMGAPNIPYHQWTHHLRHPNVTCPVKSVFPYSRKLMALFHMFILHYVILCTLATSCEELTHWKRLWCWEGLGAGGEGDNRGWDGWMASLTWWTWVSVNSGSWWWTGRPGVLQFMGSKRVGHDWATDLIW